jgi:hypothetical protein
VKFSPPEQGAAAAGFGKSIAVYRGKLSLWLPAGILTRKNSTKPTTFDFTVSRWQ